MYVRLVSQIDQSLIKVSVFGQHRRLVTFCQCKLMKGKDLRKHIMHKKTAASVLLKLFISSYE